MEQSHHKGLTMIRSVVTTHAQIRRSRWAMPRSGKRWKAPQTLTIPPFKEAQSHQNHKESVLTHLSAGSSEKTTYFCFPENFAPLGVWPRSSDGIQKPQVCTVARFAPLALVFSNPTSREYLRTRSQVARFLAHRSRSLLSYQRVTGIGR